MGDYRVFAIDMKPLRGLGGADYRVFTIYMKPLRGFRWCGLSGIYYLYETLTGLFIEVTITNSKLLTLNS